MKIVITGYTYTRENLFDVFESYPDKAGLTFILPNNWKAKDGKVVFKPFARSGFKIYHSPAFFFHSNYPLVGGLFKGWMPFIVPRLLWLRLTGKADILFTAGEPNLLSTLYNAFWAKLFGMKHIFNYWENIPYEKKDKGLKLKLKKAIIKANIRLSDGAICGMHKAEDILRSFGPKFPVLVSLHAGFDVERFRPGLEPKLRKELGLENKTVFLFVGALSYRKGIHLAFEALANLRREHNNLHFIVIGSGEYDKELKNKAKELGIEDTVTFIPWMNNEELPQVYCSADIFLYPSIPYEGWEEQFGYSIAEASLCGLPVISTKSGSIYEVLKDNETGLAVEPNNQKELESAMLKLMQNPELCKKLGEHGREFIKSNFSNKVVAEKLESFFKKVAA